MSLKLKIADLEYPDGVAPVSYTHLDVYKRQGKHCTSHRRDSHSFIFHTHFLNDFGNEFVYHTVTATRAVVPVSYTHLDVYKRQIQDNEHRK